MFPDKFLGYLKQGTLRLTLIPRKVHIFSILYGRSGKHSRAQSIE